MSSGACNCADDLHSAPDLRRALLRWYALERRDFPWRGTRDPYAVLVSEVMLQQTQAARVAQAYPRFMARWPTAESLAAAQAAELLAAWSGLGYNRRALALQRAAAEVVARGWPPDAAGLERLPGIGPYTARAVASLAFGQPVGVVDTNVRRWLVRRFGLAPDLGGQPLQALADELAAPAHGADEAARWTHATMEFGARICSGRAPRCGACPIAEGCPSRGRPAAVPVPRQAAYRGSSRAYRGAVVRLLASAPDRRLQKVVLKIVLDAESPRIGPTLGVASFDGLLGRLDADGLVRLNGDEVALGTESRPAAATIGP